MASLVVDGQCVYWLFYIRNGSARCGCNVDVHFGQCDTLSHPLASHKLQCCIDGALA